MCAETEVDLRESYLPSGFLSSSQLSARTHCSLKSLLIASALEPERPGFRMGLGIVFYKLLDKLSDKNGSSVFPCL